MADRYLKLQYTVTLDFTAGTSPPTVTGDPNIVFDSNETYMMYGARYIQTRPHVTVGARIFKSFVTLNNDFLSDLCSAINPSSAFKDGGHTMVYTPSDIRESLISESSENTYNEFPAYNAYYGSYSFDVSLIVPNYVTPQINGTTVITWEIIYVFDDSESSLYDALLALYPDNVTPYNPSADPWYIDDDLPYREEFPPMYEYTEELPWYIDDNLPYREEFPSMYEYTEELPWYIDEGLPYREEFPEMYEYEESTPWYITDDLPYRLEFPDMPEQPRRFIDPAPLPSSFTFKGINSAEFGILETLPLCLKHEQKTNFINFIDGLPYVQETSIYKSKVITVSLGLKDTSPENIDKINAWLIGTGKLIFSHDPDRYYIATCNNSLTGGERLVSLGKLPVQFNVMPFKYDNNESDSFESVRLVDAAASKGCEINYKGNAPSESAFKITGTGDIQIYSVQSGKHVEIHGLTEYCIIDIQKRKVYDENENVILNRTYGDIFDLKLVPGVNVFLISGSVTELSIKRRTRWY